VLLDDAMAAGKISGTEVPVGVAGGREPEGPPAKGFFLFQLFQLCVDWIGLHSKIPQPRPSPNQFLEAGSKCNAQLFPKLEQISRHKCFLFRKKDNV